MLVFTEKSTQKQIKDWKDELHQIKTKINISNKQKIQLLQNYKETLKRQLSKQKDQQSKLQSIAEIKKSIKTKYQNVFLTVQPQCHKLFKTQRQLIFKFDKNKSKTLNDTSTASLKYQNPQQIIQKLISINQSLKKQYKTIHSEVLIISQQYLKLKNMLKIHHLNCDNLSFNEISKKQKKQQKIKDINFSSVKKMR